MKMVANLALVTIFVFMALVCYWQAPMLRKPSASLHPSHALRRGPLFHMATGGHGLTKHRSLPIEGSYFRMSSRTPPAVCFAPAPAPWMTMGEG